MRSYFPRTCKRGGGKSELNTNSMWSIGRRLDIPRLSPRSKNRRSRTRSRDEGRSHNRSSGFAQDADPGARGWLSVGETKQDVWTCRIRRLGRKLPHHASCGFELFLFYDPRTVSSFDLGS